MKGQVYTIDFDKVLNDAYDKYKHLEFTDWYLNASKDIFLFKDLFFERYSINIPYPLFCAVVSILSPASKWEQNLKDANNLFNEILIGGDFSYTTYASNVYKARNLLNNYYFNGLNTFDIDSIYFKESGLKTKYFYHALNSLGESNNMVIDRHMLKIFGIDFKDSLTVKEYKHVNLAIFEAFKGSKLLIDRFGYVSKLQAFLWQSYVYYQYKIIHY